jgi:hypothetical protein
MTRPTPGNGDYYAPPPPPSFQPSRSPKPKWWRSVWAIAIAVGLVFLLIGVGIGGSGSAKTKTKTVAGPTETATATQQVVRNVPVYHTVTATPVIKKVVATRTVTNTITYHPVYTKYAEGTYVIGTDIKAGEYHTNGSSDCYWATLKSLDTSDIDDNNLGAGPQTIEVPSSDKALQIRGDCTFGRA